MSGWVNSGVPSNARIEVVLPKWYADNSNNWRAEEDKQTSVP